MTRPFVLIVDDDDVIRSLLLATLPAEGYDVVEVDDGERALSFPETAPAVVLLDWRMPGLSGKETLRELKRLYPHTPVIVLTAEGSVRVEQGARALGADLFFSKPFSPLQLLTAVEELLGQRPVHESA